MLYYFPLFERVLIETHPSCNRSCWFCNRTHDRSGVYRDENGRNVKKIIEPEKVISIIEELFYLGFTKLIGFHYLNEPLLDKNVLKYAMLSREKNMQPYLITNGDLLLNDDSLCEQVQEIFEYIRIGIYTFDDEKELENRKRFWINKLPNCKRLIFSIISDKKPQQIVPILNGNEPVVIPISLRDNESSKNKECPCHRPLHRLIIRNDGEILNCAEDTYGKFKLGNIHQNTIKDIWFSRRHMQICHLLCQGHREKYNLCRQCPRRATKSRYDIS